MFLRASLILCLLVGILPSAIVDASAQSRLPEFLAKLSPGDLVSGADRFAAPTGNPPVAPCWPASALSVTRSSILIG
jgi:transcriptional regulator of nitric oxide reductase